MKSGLFDLGREHCGLHDCRSHAAEALFVAHQLLKHAKIAPVRGEIEDSFAWGVAGDRLKRIDEPDHDVVKPGRGSGENGPRRRVNGAH